MMHGLTKPKQFKQLKNIRQIKRVLEDILYNRIETNYL
jgi:hypothetical protein